MEYIIVLDLKCFEELKKVLQNKPSYKRMILEFDIYQDRYYIEISRVEFCVLILGVKKNVPASIILRRLYELGDLQDEDFRSYLKLIQKDLDRIQPIE